MEEIVDSYRIQ